MRLISSTLLILAASAAAPAEAPAEETKAEDAPAEEAAAAERETLKSVNAYDAREVFSYLEARARGNRASRGRMNHRAPPPAFTAAKAPLLRTSDSPSSAWGA